MDPLEKFGRLLVSLIEKQGRVQRSVAEEAGISEQSLTNIIAGRRRIPLDKLAPLIDALDLGDEDREALLRSANEAHENGATLDHLERQLQIQGAAEIRLRLQLAALHRQRGGAVVDFDAAAREAGIEPLQLQRAVMTGLGDPLALVAAAKALDVPPLWIATGANPPQWYADLVGSMRMKHGSSPQDAVYDHAWEAERARVNRGRELPPGGAGPA